MEPYTVQLSERLLKQLSEDIIQRTNASKSSIVVSPAVAYVIVGLEQNQQSPRKEISILDFLPINLSSPSAKASNKDDATLSDAEEEHLDELSVHLVTCLIPGLVVLGIVAAPPVSSSKEGEGSDGKRINLKTALLTNYFVRALQTETDNISAKTSKGKSAFQPQLLLQSTFANEKSSSSASTSSAEMKLGFGSEGFILQSATNNKSNKIGAPMAVPIRVSIHNYEHALGLAKFVCPTATFSTEVPTATQQHSWQGLWHVVSTTSSSSTNSVDEQYVAVGGEADLVSIPLCKRDGTPPEEVTTTIQPLQTDNSLDAVVIPLLFGNTSSSKQSDAISVSIKDILSLIYRCASLIIAQQTSPDNAQTFHQFPTLLAAGLGKSCLLWNALGSLAEDEESHEDEDSTLLALQSEFLNGKRSNSKQSAISSIHFFGPRKPQKENTKQHSHSSHAHGGNCCRPLFTEKPFSGTVFMMISAALVLMTALGAGLILTSPTY